MSQLNILLTGASSFSGYWFARELSARGHRISAPLRRKKDEYSGLRRTRVEGLCYFAEVVEECPFGTDRFLDLLKSGAFDMLCHHAAEVTNYKSPEFSIDSAVHNNTFRMHEVLQALSGRRFLLSGSVFEQGEGKSNESLRAVSPYGLSKGFTSALFEYGCYLHQVKFQKFIIPNPFGPLEERRFTTYLAKQWLSGKAPTLKHPAYVRDNIPIFLLAKAYAEMIEKNLSLFSPSYLPETMEQFTVRFGKALSARIGSPCPYALCSSSVYNEPMERINRDLLSLNWDEGRFWDELAEFYVENYG